VVEAPTLWVGSCSSNNKLLGNLGVEVSMMNEILVASLGKQSSVAKLVRVRVCKVYLGLPGLSVDFSEHLSGRVCKVV
jgi:hypothetical protein